MGWLAHILGLDNLSGPWYGFWSGFGSDLGEAAILGGVWHHFNCHDPGCWRWGKHVHVDDCGVHVRSCRRHRPKGAVCE